jgi:two-component system sensor histidine kinase TctE
VRSLRDLESLSGQLVLRALPEFTPMLLSVVLGMAAVVVLTVHQTLRPVRAASRQAASLSVQRLSERLPESHLPSEVLPLVQAVNSSLERLERDYQAQRDFTAHAAHELRTPLAVLRAQLEARLTPADMREVAQEIDGLARLIEQLLCLAQLDSDTAFPAAPLDAYACAIEVARDVAPLALAKNHRISAESSDRQVHTFANATLLRQVFRNLIENAIQHTPPGTAITVSAAGASTVMVSDDGPGIAAADRDHIFERFRRGATAGGTGAGLGLAVARRILERMGGELVLDPAGGPGARFLVVVRESPRP